MLIEQAKSSVAYIKSKIDFTPEIAIVLGSGLGNFAENLEDKVYIPYSEIPDFVVSTAPGHEGRMVVGTLAGKKVLCMQGRLHYYEGYTMEEVTYPIRVLKVLGIEKLILTNSAGGLNPSFTPGDLMVITDHINFMIGNPLIGANEREFGPRFQDMTYAYNREMCRTLHNAAKSIGLKLQEGAYVSYTGPSFETPLEIKMFQSFGASAVGMSTVPEVIVANHCGLKVCAISCITNLAAGILDQPLTAEEVMIVAGNAAEKFMNLLNETVKQL